MAGVGSRLLRGERERVPLLPVLAPAKQSDLCCNNWGGLLFSDLLVAAD